MGSEQAQKKLEKVFAEAGKTPNEKQKEGIRIRTARFWLNRMGLRYGRFGKGVFVDGHEREDVVQYRQSIFIPQWQSYRQRFAKYDLREKTFVGQGNSTSRPIILITHDESTFNANDGTRAGWKLNGQNPLRPKGRGKGIMVSAFCTPGGLLKLDDDITDQKILELFPDWPKRKNGSIVRESVELLEYGKDDYWDGDKMVQQALHVMRLFEFLFPGYQALFAFDNAASHCAFSPDALVATTLLSKQPDFLAQKGRLQEEIERRGHAVIFYPKFHCELNFIERFWSSAKHYARENCTYSLNGLRRVVPEALQTVDAETIFRYYQRCERIIQAYADGLKYETEEFTQRVYASHRQVRREGGW